MTTQDLTFLINARDNASAAFEKVKEASGGASKFIQDHWKQATVALAATGAALEGLARSQQENTLAVQRLARATGLTEDEMRGLANSVTNATLTHKDALAMFDQATKQGIRSADAMKSYVQYWDMIGDATDASGPALAEASVALRAIGIEAENSEQSLDALGFITTNTTGSVMEFLTFIERAGPELRAMNMDIDDSAAVLAVLERELGMSAKMARSEFTKAVSEADGDMQLMLETLGISSETFDQYRSSVAGSGEELRARAKDFEDSRTLMQRFKAGIDDILFANGDLIGSLGNMSMVLMGLGPALKVITSLTMLKTIKTKAAAAAQWLWNAAMTANPIGILIVAIGALIAAIILIVKNWDTVREKTIEIWNTIVGFLKRVWDNIVGFIKDNWDRILAILFPAVGLPVLIARNWNKITEIVKNIWDNVVNSIKTAWNNVVSFVLSGVNWLIDQVNKVIGLINKIPGINMGEIGHVGVESPEVPTMDTGGIVRGPGLFAVGKGVTEIVRTPAGSTIGSVNVYANSYEGGQDAARGLIDELHRRGVKLGGSYA